MNRIQNIILDVGEVLLGYRWKDMLMDHGLNEERATLVAETLFADSLWEDLDLGTRSLQDIIQAYCKKYPDYREDITWFLTHGECMPVPRPDVWEKVHQLKTTGYGIYILSNYSQTLFEMHTKGTSFIQDANGIVVSYQIHKTKPNPEIYQYLLNRYHLCPENCIFFDDRLANTQAATKLGIHSVTVTSQEMLLEELEKLLV